MNRRDFLSYAVMRSAGLAFLPAAAVMTRSPAPIAPTGPAQTLPLAPLGAPPFCVVARGWERWTPRPIALARAEEARRDALRVPLDWDYLDSMAVLAEGELGQRPATWRDVAEGWGRWTASAGANFGDVAAAVAAERIVRAGVELDGPLPERGWLAEVGARCHEWKHARGQFADGCAYRLPTGMEMWEAMKGPPQDALVRVYEEAGAPWGHTREAAALYLWHAGESVRARGGQR